MDFFYAQIVNGIILGGTYALLIIGLNLILRVAGVLQYAYPHIIIICMYVYYYALRVTGNNIPVCIVITIVSGVGLSIITEPLFRPAARRGAGLSTFMIALGIAMIISDIQNKRLHEGSPIGFPQEVLGETSLIKLGLIDINAGQLFTLCGTFVILAVFLLLLYKTQQGRAFRALAQDFFTSRMRGIPVTKTSILSYLFAGILGGVSAIFLSMSLGAAAPGLGDRLALKIFAIALFAGLGNLEGGVIAAFIVGCIESTALGYVSGRWVDAVVYGVIIVTVIIRPRGLFGAKV
jgi:branched-chain amino acid transport system permease protein